MQAQNKLSINKSSGSGRKDEDTLALGHMKFAQGMGAALMYANQLHAVQQTGRLPFLKSSHLHEDVLRGYLGPGNGIREMFGSNTNRNE